MKNNKQLKIMLCSSALFVHFFQYLTTPIVSPNKAFAQSTDLQLEVSSTDESEFEDLKRSLLIKTALKDLTNTTKEDFIQKADVKSKVQNLSKKTYKLTEKIPIVIENENPANVNVVVFNSDGEVVEAVIERESISTTAILRVSPPNRFKPGRYRIQVTDSSGNVTNEDFTWGVLAINTNKSIYLPNETAKIYMAVLDETGNMVCDAKVKLDIKDPSGNVTQHSTDTNSIKVNPQCQLKEYSLEQDFEARYTVGDKGKYNLTLTATTKNGTYSINDSFEVLDEVPFDVERFTQTRIFPPLEYPVIFGIKANQDFEGEIREIVPESFIVKNIDGMLPFESNATVAATLDPTQYETVALSKPFNGNYFITQGFGVDETDEAMSAKYAKYGLLGHDGIDFAVPIGTPLLSVDDGYIARASENGDYGTTVIIQHSWGRSYYGHMSKMDKEIGDSVARGEKIGESGNTGLLTTGPHLHFGIKFNDNNPGNGYYGKVNPLPYMQNSLVADISTATPSAVLINPEGTGYQVLTWKVNIKKGETINLGYSYLAPRKSPQFYTLGPLSFNVNSDDDFPIFAEGRKWQIAVDADGSGTNTVTPTTGTPSASGQTYTFTFTSTEVMDSGTLTISVPSGWTSPSGITTAVGSNGAVVGTVEDTMNSTTGWSAGNACTGLIGLSIDLINYVEGGASISCNTGNVSSGNVWYKNISSEDWSSYTTVGIWLHSSSTITSNRLQFIYDDTTNCASELETLALGITNANTWEYKVLTFGSTTRTAVVCYGFQINHNSALDNITIKSDYLLLGPGTPTFSGSGPYTITVPLLDSDGSDTVTITYGVGGTVTNSSSEGVHTFTTQSRTSISGTLTNISSSPTVTLSSGPSNAELIRHGAWFQNGVEKPFTF